MPDDDVRPGEDETFELETPSGAARRYLRGMERVDNYELLDELGHGGMATVYRARDTRLQREVALKILHEHIASAPDNRERFVREARAAAQLEHPNIIHVYGFSSPSAPIQYIAAELIDGATLRQLVEERELLWPEVGAMIALQVARALRVAHEAGIIHRDIKPDNVMVTRDGQVKLMDFGLARLLDAQTLTMTGAVLGSPAHMAPETIEGGEIDERVDIFAFGTVLYFLTVGSLPFAGRSPAAVLNAVLNGYYEAPERANPRVGRALARCIERCLATKPDDRPESIAEVESTLSEVVKAAGIVDVDAELRAYAQDAARYNEAFRTRLLDALTERATRAASKGQVAKAVAAASRALAIAPGHAGAERILARLQQSRRARALRWLAVAAVALAALLVLAWPPSTPTPVAPAAEPADTTEPAPLPATPRVDIAQARVSDAIGSAYLATRAVLEARALAERSEPVARQVAERVLRNVVDAAFGDGAAASRAPQTPSAPSPARAEEASDNSDPTALAAADVVPVTLRIYPLSARVRIDGVNRGDASQVRSGVFLSPGSHEIELFVQGLTNGRLVERFEVVEGATNEFAFRVPWPPGFVVVTSNQPGNVVIDGRIGRTNEPIEVPITGLENMRSVTVEIVPPSGAPYSEQVRVRTEQTVNVTTLF